MENNEDNSLQSESDDSNDELWTDDEETTICLFCDNSSRSVDAAMNHLKLAHDINFPALKAKFQMDQYSFLKLINCIRSENVPASKLCSTNEVFWSDEKYLKANAYESWLSYDYDEMASDAMETVKNSDQDLQNQIVILQEKVKEQMGLLEEAQQDMNKMRIGFKRLVERETCPPSSSVAAFSCKSDDSYFTGYAHFSIHHEMLSDVVRTTSYKNALIGNKDFINGKVVLDVGCGTSILSIFASQAGAKEVVGIDNSDIIYNAMDIVKNNDISNIVLVKGRLEDTSLPRQDYDIIISEWMGYFLLFEGMLDTIIYAREKHLKEGGILLPNRCTMSLQGYGNEKLFASHVKFWDNVYGLNMSNMRKEVLCEPLIDVVDPEYTITESEIIADFDLLTVDLSYSNFTHNFSMKCIKSGKMSAFIGFFDTFFDLPNPIMFSTSPRHEPTHWKQVVFFLEDQIFVNSGDIISGTLQCKRSSSCARSLDITIEVFEKKYRYYLD